MGSEVEVFSSALVLGGGVTGTSVNRVLTKLGAKVTVYEEKLTPPSEIEGVDWDIAVVSPGWKMDHPEIERLRERSIKIISEVDLAWQLKSQFKPGQIWLGVTGTNGKTTTVELATSMLKAGGLNATACGNVGDTVIDAVMSEDDFDYLVVELSSFQLQWSNSPEFRSAAILNIADDHIDWHGSFDSYSQAKLRILDRAELAILNGDDSSVVEQTQSWSGRKIFYTLGSPAPGELGVVEELLVDRAFVKDTQAAEVIAELKDIYPKVAHSVSNSLAAAGLARSVGVDNEVISRAIQSFRPGRHRIELILEKDDIAWINDSKATNPHAAQASLSSFSSILWIAGGLAKGATMDDLVTRIKGKLKFVILIGTDRELIASALTRLAPEVPFIEIDVKSSNTPLMESVVKTALGRVVSGDTVLLAPACASMDQFKSYSDRGDQFRDAVEKLVKRREE